MSGNYSELIELIERSINDLLTPIDQQRLEDCLTDPASQAVFCDYMSLHAELHWQLRRDSLSPAAFPLESSSNSPWTLNSASDLNSRRDLNTRTALGGRSELGRRGDLSSMINLGQPVQGVASRRRLGWISLSIAMAGLALLVGYWGGSGWNANSSQSQSFSFESNQPTQSRQPTQSPQGASAPSMASGSVDQPHSELSGAGLAGDGRKDAAKIELARITGTRNCRWENPSGMQEFGFDTALYAGQTLKLTQGLAEVTFSSGAKLILEAPATLDVAAYNESYLRNGRMTALVPDGADGFRVNMDGLVIVDRGTEFGVAADEVGKVEVHVFQGLVEGHFGEEWGTERRLVHWQENSAVSIDLERRSIDALSDVDPKFVRSLASSTPGSGLLAKEDFEYPPAPLALQNGGYGWGGPWTVLSTQGDAAIANAIQQGSLKVNGLMNSGNRASILGNFNRVRRSLSTSIGGVFDSAGYIEDQDGARLIGRDGTTLYISFSQRVSDTDEEFYGFELNRGDGNRNRVLCIGNGAHRSWLDGPPRSPNREMGATGWAVTSEFNGPDRNNLLDLGSLGDESTNAVYVVVKLEFGEGNWDRVSVFVNPENMGDERECEPQVVGHGNFAFDQISLANFGGFKTYEVDHIRIGRTFRAVTSHSFEAVQVAFNSSDR